MCNTLITVSKFTSKASAV